MSDLVKFWKLCCQIMQFPHEYDVYNLTFMLNKQTGCVSEPHILSLCSNLFTKLTIIEHLCIKDPPMSSVISM